MLNVVKSKEAADLYDAIIPLWFRKSAFSTVDRDIWDILGPKPEDHGNPNMAKVSISLTDYLNRCQKDKGLRAYTINYSDGTAMICFCPRVFRKKESRQISCDSFKNRISIEMKQTLEFTFGHEIMYVSL